MENENKIEELKEKIFNLNTVIEYLNTRIDNLIDNKSEFVYKLFRYNYITHRQGTEDIYEEYVLLYVPKDASYNNNLSVIFNKKNKNYYHEIQRDSIKELTILF